jgi:hypothetical protein
MLQVNQLIGFGAGGIDGPTVSYINTTVSTSNSTTYTFSAASLGPAFVGRHVFVVVYSYQTSSGRTISSVTIGGNSATVQASKSTGASTTGIVAIYSARVDSGDTGNIVVTHSGGMECCGVSVYAVGNVNALSITPYDGALVTATNSWATTLSLRNGDVCIFANRVATAQAGNITFTSPFVKRFDAVVEAGNYGGATADAVITADNAAYAYEVTHPSVPFDLAACGVVLRNT